MNRIELAGTIVGEPTFSHEILGERFYKIYLSSIRASGVSDILPCIISDAFLNDINSGSKIRVLGNIRTRNVKYGYGTHLEVFVFVNEVYEYDVDLNCAIVEGYICKQPKCRETPLGRQISDFILASNRTSGRKSDYIPCIAWGRNAIRITSEPVGTGISISGRLQSREYIKSYDDGTEETKIAYELSITCFHLTNNEKEEI